MKVRLISITQPAATSFETSDALRPPMNAEELIVYAARVSNPGNQNNHETAPNLLHFLIRNKHWSPFEMANMTVEIVTSRAIAQQILRHRSFSFQEFSQRYAAVSEFENIELRKQGEKNRQSSEEVFDPIICDDYGDTGDPEVPASKLIELHIQRSEWLYKELLSKGAAKECARMVLPLTTQSTLYMNGSVRSWIHYLEQRTSLHTQLEHREIALEIQKIFIKQFPSISEALGFDPKTTDHKEFLNDHGHH